MHDKELPPPLGAALSQIDPERRRLLGILLTGAAALPLLTSTTLGAQENSAQSTNSNSRGAPIKHTPIELKTNSGAIKGDTQIKGDRTIKMDSQIKGDRTVKMNAQVKSSTATNNATQIKGDSTQIKMDSTIKSTMPIKSSTGAMKTNNAPIKSSSTPQQ